MTLGAKFHLHSQLRLNVLKQILERDGEVTARARQNALLTDFIASEYSPIVIGFR